MWPACYLALAVIAHGCLVRIDWRKSLVSKFLVIGFVFGITLTGHMWVIYGVALPTFAAVTFYAFACELYMFLFGMVISSVSSRLLLTLKGTMLSGARIANMYGADGMVERRLERLVEAGLLNRDGDKWELSREGIRVMRTGVALKRLFGHPIQ